MMHSFYDYVIPELNEEEFCIMGKKLNYSGLFFTYNFNNYVSNKVKIQNKLDELSKKYSLELYISILCEKESDIQNAKKQKKKVVFLSNKQSNIRDVVQKHKPDIVTNLEFQNHDFIHHRAGINQVIGRLMAEKKVLLGISLDLLFSTKYKAEVIGRIKQNISIAKKYNVKIKLFTLAKSPYSMKSAIDISSLLVCAGLNSRNAKETLIY